MITITLQRLTLEHFKGIGQMSIDFGGRSASIFGDNATGKTTIYDGYLWLLTGKDSLGRSDIEIKPLGRNGNIIDHSLRSAVEAVLSVDGREVTLRREFYELWSKKRGRTEATYDGNSTDYFINGVPKAKRAYEDAVAELIPLDKLRLLSDTAAFASLPWKQRRDILFDLADMGTDLEIMARHEEYAPLLDAAGQMGLEDLRASLKARRKKVNGRLNDLPIMIAENRKTEQSLGELPFERLRASLVDLEEDEHRLTAEIAKDDTAATGALQNSLDALRLDLRSLEQDNLRHRQEQEAKAPNRSGLEAEIRRLEQSIERLVGDYKRQSDRYHQYHQTAEAHEANAEEYRRMWSDLSASTYDGSASCPTCGQPMPADKQAEALERWEKTKRDKLHQIQGLGSGAASHARQMRSAAQDAQEDMIRIEGELAKAKDDLEAARAQLAGLETPVITDLPDYAARKITLSDRISAAQVALNDAQQAGRERTDELRRKRQSVRAEMDGIRSKLAKEDTLRSLRARIAELEQERRELAEELARIDRLTDLADDFTRFKGQYTTMAVNGQFCLAQFKLFAEQVNGETPPACDILCGGVPYDGGLNNGARINVGLDIIRTLSRYYGYAVPVFVDNAESVTELEIIDTQMIRLEVSKADGKVRIEIE